MDWCEWFGFQYDPFFDKPLESQKEMEKWLIIDKKNEEQITPLIRQMSHVPFISLVVGDRGVGKSTLMYYSMNLAGKSDHLPVYVGLDHVFLEFSRRPTYDITETLMYEFGAKLLDALAKFKHGFFSQNQSILLDLARYLGLAYQESEGFIPSGKPYRLDFFELKRYILATLNLMKNANVLVLLSIDNLDKISKLEILKDFFTAPFAQTFFDDLRKGGVSILIAAATPFWRTKEGNSDLKYLAQAVHVNVFSPTQTMELLTKRVRFSNDPTPRNPFEDEAMISIGLGKKGITRDILTEARNLCIKAYERKLPSISKVFVDQGLVSFNESRTLYEILDKNEKLKPSILNLCRLAAYTDIDLEQAISAIMDATTGKNLQITDALLSALINSDIVVSSGREKFMLSDSLSALLGAIKNSGWSIDRFLRWILVRDSIHILSDGIPGVGSRASVDKFGPVPGVSKTAVDMIIGETRQTAQTRSLFQEAISELEESKRILNKIGTLSWDDIDNVTVYKEINRALVSFLMAFSKLYISCATIRVVRMRSASPTDLIESTIHNFQEEFNVSFQSFHRFQRLRANMNGLARGGFSPSHSDVKAAFDDFEEIVTEYTRFWQGISKNFVALEPVDERHASTLEEVTKFGLLMGYELDRPEYKRFKIDGEQYYRLGFLKFPLNETSIDAVRERRLKDRSGENRSYFLLCSVKPDSKNKATVQEILTFIHKCNDGIAIIDRENTTLLQGWPRYLLLYVSVSGFEPGIQAALASTTRSPKSQVLTLDYYGMENLKRQLVPGKRIPTAPTSEEQLDDLRTKDLEQLLRLGLTINNIIHEKFEKIKTVLLADMKDFTEKTMKDSVKSAEAVQKLSDILEKNVKAYGGIGANTEGDSFVAVFDKPEQAGLAALESIKELELYNQSVLEESHIFVRIGISTGEIIFKNEKPFVGNVLNIAARIMKEAKPNTLVTTEQTYKLISAFRSFEFSSTGEQKLKGIEKPVAVYEIRPKDTSDALK